MERQIANFFYPQNKVPYTSQDQGCAEASEGKQPSTTGGLDHRETKGGTWPATTTTAVPEPHHAAVDASVDDELVYHAHHRATRHYSPAPHRAAHPAPISPIHGAPTGPSAPADPGVLPGPSEGELDGWSLKHDLVTVQGPDKISSQLSMSPLFPTFHQHQVLPAELLPRNACDTI